MLPSNKQKLHYSRVTGTKTDVKLFSCFTTKTTSSHVLSRIPTLHIFITFAKVLYIDFFSLIA